MAVDNPMTDEIVDPGKYIIEQEQEKNPYGILSISNQPCLLGFGGFNNSARLDALDGTVITGCWKFAKYKQKETIDIRWEGLDSFSHYSADDFVNKNKLHIRRNVIKN